MNIEHLRLFIRIAALNNISLAGKEFGLSPAVSSAHINKLEQSLGVRLIHRTTRKVSLTQEGIAFLPHAEEVLASVELAKASVGAGAITPQGHLRVAAPASFGRMHLVPPINDFLRQFPDIHIDLKLSDTIIDMVDGGFDIAIRDAELNDSTLIAKKLATDHRIICASPDYIQQHGVPKTPQELVEHQCITLPGLETWHFKTPDGEISIKTKGRLQADNGEAVRDACVYGAGITISSTWCCWQHIQNKQLVPVLQDFPLVSKTSVWAVYPSSRLLAPKVRCFIDFFNDFFGDTPYWDEQLKNIIAK